jgi:hypothetical protein
MRSHLLHQRLRTNNPALRCAGLGNSFDAPQVFTTLAEFVPAPFPQRVAIKFKILVMAAMYSSMVANPWPISWATSRIIANVVNVISRSIVFTTG